MKKSINVKINRSSFFDDVDPRGRNLLLLLQLVKKDNPEKCLGQFLLARPCCSVPLTLSIPSDRPRPRPHRTSPSVFTSIVHFLPPSPRPTTILHYNCISSMASPLPSLPQGAMLHHLPGIPPITIHRVLTIPSPHFLSPADSSDV